MSFEGWGPPAPIGNLRSVSMVKFHLEEEDLADIEESTSSDEEQYEEDEAEAATTPSSTDRKIAVSDSAMNSSTSSLPPSARYASIMIPAASSKGRGGGGLPTPTPKKDRKKTRFSSMKKKKQDSPARERPSEGEAWPARDALSFTRSLVFYGQGSITEEHTTACQYIQKARAMREKYYGSTHTNISNSDLLTSPDLQFEMGKDGVAVITHEDENVITVPSIEDFISDYQSLVEICSDGAMRSFCFQRLQMLTSVFKMHITANGSVEEAAKSNILGTDFYRTMKVDNHIHLAAAATAKQFVIYVKSKLQNEPNTVVLDEKYGDAETKTLIEVFGDSGLEDDHLTIDAFSVLADHTVYQRFDNFNSKYSPFRMSKMRQIFLKTENCLRGRYFAELTKIVLARHEASKGHNSAAEMRLSIYGMERTEWLQLAKWILRDWRNDDYPGPVLSSHNRWMVQVPRLWRIYYKKGGRAQSAEEEKRSFQGMLENLFCPIIEATLRPEENPEIAELLTHIVGFDSVDDEGAAEEPCDCTRPLEWTQEKNPAYCWQLYYLWANIEVLNVLRKSRGLNTFAFRPHAGETGDTMHLAATYMLCPCIAHGINLDRQVSLQYLYYLDQVGLSISPLSNNFLFRKIAHNPFPKLFKRGLNVTLSTDDPLLFHMSDDALLEEYSVARASFDLSMTDMSEIARNSILQSGFEDSWKKKWLGPNYSKGITHCDETKTHVPLIRAKFRAEHLAMEHLLVHLIAAGKGREVLQEMMVQFGLARDAHRNILLNSFSEVPSFPEQNQL
uniref:Uncharacterized protein n=2 Tax=Ditylum brightwellii TaxID=49249 RepID=A0A6U3UET0_9STRA|mmetsp:Transcript_33544/g.50025  ORF Transcript_33544/g.50025 Transcript_33544/m.50025 type:complete len:787 (+) Transcript_33544:271-2631(+)